MTTPRVSVIIPTFNSAALVVEAIESVLAQSYPAFEVIVVDDGSVDNTRSRLAEFKHPVRYVRKENGGVSSARNRGLEEASGDLIAFLDADDVWHPDKLRRQVEVMNRRPELGLLGTETMSWPGQFPSTLPKSLAERDISMDALVVKNLLVTSSIVIRREVTRTVGLFDRSLNGPEDYDYWLRTGRVAPIAKLSLPLTGYRNTGGSLSKQAFRMEEGMRAILRKLEASGAFRERARLRSKAWGYFHYSCAIMHRAAGNYQEAVRNSLQSFWRFPAPFRPSESREPFGRARLLLAAIRRSPHGLFTKESPF
jgi:glycosyltransferase involved in cell wall biosynthesis